MKYEEALKYITTSKKFGEKHGLEGIARLCKMLSDPQKKLKFVHVAGTNGKGSTCSYIANILKEAGYKTGLYTSPFIYEFNERIRVNNENISDEDLAEVMTEVKSVIDKLLEDGYPQPTEFEVITACAFLYFFREKCDIVVLEVGLGGRFDSTNIIENPLCCAISSIGYDHMQYLGETLSDIAFEKCGIIKEGSPVVIYPDQKEEAKKVIEKIATDRKADVIRTDKADINIKEMNLDGSIFDACGLFDVETNLSGEHQVYNAVTAINVILELKRKGYKINEGIIKKGISGTKWPARMEKLCDNPCVIFDGAHNTDGMEVFVNNIKKLADGKRVIIILGMVKDKEYDKCIRLLDGVADVLITTTVENPRKETAENLMKKAEFMNCEKYITKNVGEAIDRAFSIYDENSIIFAAGSLYMASEVKINLK